MADLVDLIKEFAVYSAVFYPLLHTSMTVLYYGKESGQRPKRPFLERLLDKYNLTLSAIPTGVCIGSALFYHHILKII